MYGSFVVKFKNLGDRLEIPFPSIYFKEFFLDNIKELSSCFKVNILKTRINNIEIETEEAFFLRISYFEEEAFIKLSQELFKYKLLKLPFFQFEILSFVSKNKWNEKFDDINIEDQLILDFYTPYVAKFGDNFVTEFNAYLFLNSIYKEENIDNKFNLKKISNKIKIETLELFEKRVNFDANFGFGIKCIIKLDFSDLSYYDKEFIKNLIKIGYYKGSGYRKDLGYGMYLVKEFEDEYSNT